MTRAQFVAAIPTLAAMSPQAQAQTLGGWLISGRVKVKLHPQTGAEDFDQAYVGSENRRAYVNTQRTAGVTAP